MGQGKTIIVALVTLIIGFGGGFVLRPVISPVMQNPNPTQVVSGPAPVAAEPRGTQYFVEHIAEARQVVAGCRNGSVRGGECATAEEDIIKVDARERRKRFFLNN